jgi:hypothetical protein
VAEHWSFGDPTPGGGAGIGRERFAVHGSRSRRSFRLSRRGRSTRTSRTRMGR